MLFGGDVYVEGFGREGWGYKGKFLQFKIFGVKVLPACWKTDNFQILGPH